MYFVYILLLTNGKHYIGSTGNIDQRVESHNLGLNHYTSKFLPCRLLYHREYETKQQAMTMERKLKKMKSIKIIEEFMQGTFQ